MKTLEQEIYDKRYPHTYNLVLQALKLHNSGLFVSGKKVSRKQNKTKDKRRLKCYLNKLKAVTICPYKHGEMDRAYYKFIS